MQVDFSTVVRSEKSVEVSTGDIDIIENKLRECGFVAKKCDNYKSFKLKYGESIFIRLYKTKVEVYLYGDYVHWKIFNIENKVLLNRIKVDNKHILQVLLENTI